jgi:hypothetical protein
MLESITGQKEQHAKGVNQFIIFANNVIKVSLWSVRYVGARDLAMVSEFSLHK